VLGQLCRFDCLDHEALEEAYRLGEEYGIGFGPRRISLLLRESEGSIRSEVDGLFDEAPGAVDAVLHLVIKESVPNPLDLSHDLEESLGVIHMACEVTSVFEGGDGATEL